MKRHKNYQVKKLGSLRKIVRASVAVTSQKNAIHLFSEVDVSHVLGILKDYKDRHGVKLSFTGYLAKAFSNTILKYPGFNSFIAGNKHVFMDDVNISILMERKIGEDYVPEPLVLYQTESHSLADITGLIRQAQKKANESDQMGNLSSSKFIRLIPGFLLKSFIKLADRNIKMGVKFGKLAITSIGMFGKNPFWVIPHGSATVLLSVGSMLEKKEPGGDVSKHLCLTVSFDHDIIDGAPAARFMNDLIDEIKSGKAVRNIMDKI